MAEKPTVLVFSTAYTPFVGGAELAIQEIARRLKGDFDFVIITARFRRTLKKQEDVPEGTIFRLGWGTRLDKLFLPILGCLFALRKLEMENKKSESREGRFLLWGVMVSYASLAALLVRFLKPRIPFVLTIQEGDREWEKSLSAPWWKIIFKKTNHVTAISHFLADRVREVGYQGPLSIVPNGVDKRFFSDRDIEHKSLARSPVIFSASRLVYKNGIDLLLRASARLKDEFSFRVVLAGDGPLSENLEALAGELRIRDRVDFLGTVPYDTLPREYHRADLFVRPSRSEGLGSAFLEAMYAGCITIGTNVGGVVDFLEDRKTGFVAEADDAESLAAKMKEALQLSDSQKENIIRNAQERIKKNYLWDTIANQMNKIFLSLL